jgi:hypothetical protein
LIDDAPNKWRGSTGTCTTALRSLVKQREVEIALVFMAAGD